MKLNLSITKMDLVDPNIFCSFMCLVYSNDNENERLIIISYFYTSYNVLLTSILILNALFYISGYSMYTKHF